MVLRFISIIIAVFASYFLWQWLDVYDVFISFKSHVETLSDQKNIKKKIHLDGGGKFRSSLFHSLLSTHSITHKLSCPCTPKKNVMAEQKHCHLVETVLALLPHSHMPPSYWLEALGVVVFLRNQMPKKKNSLQHLTLGFFFFFINIRTVLFYEYEHAILGYILIPVTSLKLGPSNACFLVIV